jgi:hypothetical protein
VLLRFARAVLRRIRLVDARSLGRYAMGSP